MYLFLLAVDGVPGEALLLVLCGHAQAEDVAEKRFQAGAYCWRGPVSLRQARGQKGQCVFKTTKQEDACETETPHASFSKMFESMHEYIRSSARTSVNRRMQKNKESHATKAK